MPICFILFVGTTLAIHIMMRKNKVDLKKDIEDVMEKEMQANMTRKRDVEDKFYIKPDVDILPIKNYEETDKNKKIINIQNKILKKSKLPMLRFDEQISNTDLKLKYGFSNLDKITIYEEHYNSYMKELVSWAEMLLQEDNTTDAEIILNEALRLKCDLSKAYILLIDIYKKNNRNEKLSSLRELVENSELSLKSKILKNF